MHDNIAIIQQNPSRIGIAFRQACFMKFRLHFARDLVGQTLEHPITRSADDDKIVSKGCDVFDIKDNDIFSLFIFNKICDFPC